MTTPFLQVIRPDDPPPTPPDGDEAAALITSFADRIEADAELLTAALRTYGNRLDLAALIDLRAALTAASRPIAEAVRLVGALGHAWLTVHGKRGRAEIDGVAYRASTAGSSTSLKVADKARLADTWFRERLAPWLAEHLGEDPDDGASPSRWLLSLVAEKLSAVATIEFKASALRDEWHLDPAAYATPSTGAGPAPTFEKVPDPRTKEKQQ